MIDDGFYQIPSSNPNTVFPLSPGLQPRKTTIFPNLGFGQKIILGFYLLLLEPAIILSNQAPG
ncbi:hypothetical protein, partial [Treponema zioleckii]|uniref:hypothetical protein n=1 Tax=Treponema zioleckii TaxID=331680 RepID=UPI001A931564